MHELKQIRRTSAAYKKALKYWEGRLADCEGPYVFPEYGSRLDGHQVTVMQTLPVETMNHIQRISQGNAMAELGLLLSAFTWYLWRCQPQPWLAVQIPIEEGMPFTFVQKIDGNHSLKEHVLVTRQLLSEGLSIEIVDMSDVFSSDAESKCFTNICFGSDKIFSSDCESDHSLQLMYLQGKEFSITYKKNVLGENFSKYLVSGICHFLENLSDSANKLSSLKWMDQLIAGAIVDEPEKQQLLTEQFSSIVKKYPDKTALIDRNITWTYRQLDEESNKLARHMNGEYGIAEQSAVAVLMENCAEAFLSMLAVLKSGGTYVPIDPYWPKERISLLVELADIKLLLTRSDYLEKVLFQIPVFAIDFQLEMLTEPTTELDLTLSPQSLAYILFTSGTTGVPRGVQVEHGAMAHMVQDQTKYMNLHPGDRFAQPYSLTFDASLLCSSVTLLSGATLVPLPKECLAPDKLKGFFNKHDINVASFIPSVLRTLEPSHLDNIKLLICGGEKILASDVRRYGKNKRFVNSYGTTETTCCACTQDISDNIEEDAYITVGAPIKGTYIRILDQHKNPKLPGMIGEVWIGGRHLARGYLKAPEDNLKNFIEDPFLNNTRLYKTGDLGRITSTGCLEIMGRCDRQFKIHGYRIEPIEIEAILNTHTGIKVGHVEAFDSETGIVRMVAFVVLQDEIAQMNIEAFLKERLPQYCMPHEFVLLEDLPRNKIGKLDRDRLKELWQQAAKVTVKEGHEDLTETEFRLLDYWRKLFADNSLDSSGNFFLLGGHSLLAIQLLSYVQSTFCVEIPLSSFLANPTISYLAGEIDRCPSEKQFVTKMFTAPDESYYPVTDSQIGFWIQEQISSSDGRNHVPRCFKIKGEFDAPRFVEAVNTLSQRHEALRMNFILSEEREPKAFFHQENIWSWSESEINGRDVLVLIRNEHHQSFDLEKGSLMRIHYFKGDEESYLVMTFHHIICDGWSLAIFLKELRALYNGDENLAVLNVRLRDCLYWHQHYMNESKRQVLLQDWKNKLNGYHNEILVPLDHPRGQVSMRSGDHSTIRMNISDTLWASLRSFSAQNNVSHFILLISVLAKLLYTESGRTSIRLGAPVAGRQHQEMEPHMCCFLNLMVFQLNLHLEDSFQTMVSKVSEEIIWGLEHSQIGFSSLVQLLGTGSSKGRHPLFDIEIDYRSQNMEADPETWNLNGVQVEKFDKAKTEGGKFDFDFLFMETAVGLNLELCYDNTIYLKETAERLAEAYLLLLEESLTHSQKKLGETVLRKPVPMDKSDLKNKRKSRLLRHKKKKQSGDFAITPEVCLPEFPGQPLVDRLEQDASKIRDSLPTKKAILYRGFSIKTEKDFQATVRALGDEPFNYIEKSSLRKEVRQGIYTSTEHPEDQEIKLHCEHSYSYQWPLRLIFSCLTPAAEGGATTLSDAQKVRTLLPRIVQDRFLHQGVIYVRNFGNKLGLDWQYVFGTDSKREVENYCREHQIRYEWWGNRNLKTYSKRPAFRSHPITGELLWFNHAYFFNPRSLDQNLYANLMKYCREDTLPFNTFYGDGQQIEKDVLAEISKALNFSKISHYWQKGDFLILDNMLVAHGRMPFRGERKVLLAMTQIQRDNPQK